MSPPSRIDLRLATLLVATDAAFVALHFAAQAGVFGNPLLSLFQDGGFAEWFQYTKEFWVCLLLGAASVRRRSAALLALSALFAYLLVDDARQVHERFGLLAVSWGLVTSNQVGELLWCGAVGAAFLVPIGLGYLRAGEETRRVVRWTLGLVVALAGFAGGVDTLNRLVYFGGLDLGQVGGEVLEEAGELLVMSATLTFAFGLVPERLAHASRTATPAEAPRPLPPVRAA